MLTLPLLTTLMILVQAPNPTVGISLRVIAEAEVPHWQVLYEQAEDYDNQQQYSQGEAIYRQILNEPRSPYMNDYMYYYTQVQLGRNLQNQGRLGEAIEVFANVLKNSTDENVSVWARSALEQTQEQLQESEQNIREGLQRIKQEATEPWGYEFVARGLATQHKLEEALTFLETRLNRSLSPEEASAMAEAAQRIYQYPEAISLYRQIVRRYPNYEPAKREWLELLDNWGGETEETIAVYQEFIRDNPNDITLVWGLARNLEEAGKLKEAIAIYEGLIRDHQAESDHYLDLGSLLERTQQSDRALIIYLQSIQTFPEEYPNDPRCHVVRETAYDRFVKLLVAQNRLDQLLTIFEQLQPTPTVEMYYNLALVLEYQGYQEQLKIFQSRLQELDPQGELAGGGGCGGW